jgi:2-desacetyl-2-hydroxyethyl bacteriochlorophyllide A dehydrogenase
MKAIVYEGPKQIAFRDLPVPRVKEGRALIKVSHAGICGSDMTIYLGKHPRAKAPLVPGHEFSGWVASEHPLLPLGTLVTVFPYLSCGKCEMCASGRSNACTTMQLIGIDQDGGMAEYVLVPEDSLYLPPAGVDPALAAFIEPIGISVHAMRFGGYRPGDRVLIFGAGSIGMTIALTLRQYGARNLMICEPNPDRVKVAQELGFDAFQADEDTLAKIYSRCDGGADCVYDCAGHQSVIDVLPDAVKIGGKIIIVAGYKNPPTMNFQKGMMREFSVQFVRNCLRDDYAVACELAGRESGYRKLLNKILPPEQCEEGFQLLARPSDAVKVMFHLNKEA